MSVECHEKNLLMWLSNNGALFPKLNWPASHHEFGYRCGIATETITSGEPICSIPYKLIICAPNCLRYVDPDDELQLAVQKLWKSKQLSGDSLLCTCICIEVLKKEKSEFEPYITFLLKNEEPGTLERWDEEELKHVQDSALVTFCEMRKKELRTRYHRVCSTVNKGLGLDSDSGAKAEGLISFENFQWSWHIIQARAFGRRIPWSALVPLADCLNHSNRAVRYALDSVSDGSCMSNPSRGDMVDPDSGKFTIFPSGDNFYEKGGEIFNSYGRRKNDHLLLDYGFSLLNNEHETVDVRVTLSPPGSGESGSGSESQGKGGDEAEIYRLRKKLLLQHGQNSSRVLKIRSSRICSEGVLFFRVVNMTKDQLLNPEREKAGKGSFQLPGVDAINKTNEVIALTSFANVLSAVGGSEWTTARTQDEKLLENVLSKLRDVSLSQAEKTKCERETVAIQYRLTRKDIVYKNIVFLKNAIEEIET